MGLGKSQALRRALTYARTRGRRAVVLSPTRELAAEACAKHRKMIVDELIAGGMPEADASAEATEHVRHIQGRHVLCVDQDNWGVMCEVFERARQSPKPVCDKCPSRTKCPAYAQMSDDWSGIVYGQHSHLTSKLMTLKPGSDKTPDLLAIDESILGTALGEDTEKREIRFADFKGICEKAIIRARVRKGGRIGREEWGPINDLDLSLKRLVKILRSTSGRISREDLGWFAETREQKTADKGWKIDDACELVRDWIWTLRDGIKLRMTRAAEAKLAGRDTGDYRREAEQLLEQLRGALFAEQIFMAFKATLDIPERERVFGVKTFLNREGVKTVHCQLARRFPSALANVPVICLDGTAEEVLYRSLVRSVGWQQDVTVIHSPTQPGVYELYQYCDRQYGRGAFIDFKSKKIRQRNVDRLVRLVAAELAKHEALAEIEGRQADQARPLIVTQAGVDQVLMDRLGHRFPNLEIRHFGAIRGLDGFKKAPGAIIVGRPMPTTFELEDLAEALVWNDETVGSLELAARADWGTHQRLVHMRNGDLRQVRAETVREPRVEGLRKAIADAEGKQAINRLRLYDRTADCPAELHVLGTWDADMPVDELRREEDTERDLGDASVAGGIFYRSAETARTAYPDWVPTGGKGQQAAVDAWRWGEVLAATEWIKLSPNLYRNLLYRLGDKLVRARVAFEGTTVDGRSRYAEDVLVARSRFADASAAVARIESQTGLIVSSFQWEDEAAPSWIRPSTSAARTIGGKRRTRRRPGCSPTARQTLSPERERPMRHRSTQELIREETP